MQAVQAQGPYPSHSHLGTSSYLSLCAASNRHSVDIGQHTVIPQRTEGIFLLGSWLWGKGVQKTFCRENNASTGHWKVKRISHVGKVGNWALSRGRRLFTSREVWENKNTHWEVLSPYLYYGVNYDTWGGNMCNVLDHRQMEPQCSYLISHSPLASGAALTNKNKVNHKCEPHMEY